MIYNPPEPNFSLTLRYSFKSSCERVFQAWTEPQALERWFKPLGSNIKVKELDLKVGGAYWFTIIEPGTERHYVRGTYLEILPYEKLVFTWASDMTNGEDTLVTLQFSEQSGVTELVLTHEWFKTDDLRLAHTEGWQSVLLNLVQI
jgi:uncharacterized protein YndB with AHSA1/START domain